MRRLLLLALLAGVSSCGEPPQPAQAAARGGELVLDAHGVPAFRAGLWEVERTDSSVPGEVVRERECIGPDANEALAKAMSGESPNCKVARSGGVRSVRVESVCTQSGSTITTNLSVEGADTAYVMKLKMSVLTPDGKTSGAETVDKGRWVGACPSGMSPGDSVEAP